MIPNADLPYASVPFRSPGQVLEKGFSILVAIANYGTGNRQHLERLISAYRAMRARVDIVVLSNIPKDLGTGVEVRVGLPSPNPWSLPFAHRKLFIERQRDYDLYIYSEDDTLILQHNIEAFLEAVEQLSDGEIPGFLRSEVAADGSVYISSIHSHFRWRTSSVQRKRGGVYAEFSNEHSACFILTQHQLARAIRSGGFVVEPHQGRHDMLCTAATDPYTQCGMKKLIRLDRIDDFILPHLPNKYVGRMGIHREDLETQKKAMMEILENPALIGRNFDVEAQSAAAGGNRNCYERPSGEVVESVGRKGWRILSVGCGWGESERALSAKGARVTGIPIDHVFGRMSESRGIEIVQGPALHALELLRPQRFDAILFNGSLHLASNPSELLSSATTLLREGGVVVVKAPNLRDWRRRIAQWRARADISGPSSGPSGLRMLPDHKVLHDWLAAIPSAQVRVLPLFSPRRRRLARLAPKIFGPLLASEWLAVATVRQNPALVKETQEHSPASGERAGNSLHTYGD